MPPERVRRTQFAVEGGSDRSLRCSFCLRPVGHAKDAVVGPGVAICRDCVALCVEIFDEMGQPLHVGPRAQERVSIPTKARD
jgi:hypothetical protein